MSALSDLHALQRITRNRAEQHRIIRDDPRTDVFQRNLAHSAMRAFETTLEDIQRQISALLREAVDA